MSDHQTTGQCLCGAVKYSVAKEITETGACHCAMCRRWSGGVLFATAVGDAVTFSGEENITVFR
ncbi:MAG: GFA family protein, partial [Alphaproteobacteria bacterium]